ncbi:MAG: NAD(P)H-dependent oxidoreductase [Paludibacter sp. 47-17]|nr:MAG: NAD(P)H-dependent oxidoreductase [Paludibacter sp. SCN 50-10]OJX90744.1 MAG: NAD(P)H-dependent oxidoreductase [Paludibacter sp. 47-17]
MHFIESLNKRYASKQMNGKKVSPEKVTTILESIRLAPTSLGLQPFKVLVVESQELKDKIFEKAAQGQPQIPNSSQVLVFACYKSITTEILDEYTQRIVTQRPTLPLAKVTAYRQMIDKSLNRPDKENFNWAARQAYIALGFALTAAAVEQVDSVPIEGYNPAALDELLGLEDKNLGSVCMMAIGYRDEATDYNATLPKVRKNKTELFDFL